MSGAEAPAAPAENLRIPLPLGVRLRRLALPLFVLQGAFLAFMLEPMAGRRLVALHGAGIHVWATCMMFFSGVLFLAYLYAHLVAPRIGGWHLAFVASALLWLGGGEPAAAPGATPVVSVLLSLLRMTAVPFCVLATTSVVAQRWLVGSGDPGSDDPYHLYAASNVGSLAGLLCYPLLIEPLFGLGAQRLLWNDLLVGYVGLAFLLVPSRPRQGGRRLEAAFPGVASPAATTYWFLLSLAPAMALLAATNLIANGMGSLPLVWVAPLAVYLGTFILAFRKWPARASFLRRNAAELLVLGVILATGEAALLLLFLVALAGHTELHRVRPNSRQLTFYYLVIAAGGWAGAAFVSLAAPMVFSDLYEWPLALIVLSGALVVARQRERTRSPGIGEDRRRRRLRLLVLAITAGTVLSLLGRGFADGSGAVRLRNLYGTYRITERPARPDDGFDAAEARVRYLIHSGTVHGLQLTAGPGRFEPLGYYHRAAPVGDAIGSLPDDARVAVIGLGTGATAAHFGAGDEVVFYELDPDAESIARRYFSYLDDSQARIRIVVGDARLTLARDALAPVGGYDLVFVDAFSGDAVPSQLLTLEALELYLRRLRPGGLLLFHVSSHFYDFNPVLKAAGEALGLHGARVWSGPDLEPLEMASRCYALARDPERLAPLLERGWASDAGLRAATPWTDDYVNILAPLAGRLRERLSARLSTLL